MPDIPHDGWLSGHLRASGFRSLIEDLSAFAFSAHRNIIYLDSQRWIEAHRLAIYSQHTGDRLRAFVGEVSFMQGNHHK